MLDDNIVLAPACQNPPTDKYHTSFFVVKFQGFPQRRHRVFSGFAFIPKETFMRETKSSKLLLKWTS